MKKIYTLAILMCFCLTGVFGQHVYVDWTSANSSGATGSHPTGGVVVIGAPGSTVSSDGAVTTNSHGLWNSPSYTPPQPASDLVGFRFNNSGDRLVIDFENPVKDVVLNLHNLQGNYTFSGPVSILSSNGAPFTASGDALNQNFPTNAAFDGTIKISGIYSSITVTGVSYLTGCTSGCDDGVNFHVAALDEPVAIPTLNQWGLIILALTLLTVGAVFVRNRTEWNPETA